jgi:hypothetical protein
MTTKVQLVVYLTQLFVKINIYNIKLTLTINISNINLRILSLPPNSEWQMETN